MGHFLAFHLIYTSCRACFMAEADVKDAIEEMIEESYLLGLSEEEILADFSRFIDTCYTVIQDHVKSRAALSRLAENLAREKTSTRSIDLPTELGKVAAQDAQRACAEKAARRKRMVLKAIADYDPQLVRLINEQRFQVDLQEVVRPKLKVGQGHDWERYGQLLLQAGCITVIALLMVLIYIRL